MKTFVTITLLVLLTGCATVDPYQFTDRCIMEGHGRETPTHDACKNYYAKQYAEYRRREVVWSLNKAADRESQNTSLHCSRFGNQVTCGEY